MRLQPKRAQARLRAAMPPSRAIVTHPTARVARMRGLSHPRCVFLASCARLQLPTATCAFHGVGKRTMPLCQSCRAPASPFPPLCLPARATHLSVLLDMLIRPCRAEKRASSSRSLLHPRFSTHSPPLCSRSHTYALACIRRASGCLGLGILSLLHSGHIGAPLLRPPPSSDQFTTTSASPCSTSSQPPPLFCSGILPAALTAGAATARGAPAHTSAKLPQARGRLGEGA
jgi:hypothetical protein